MRLLMVGLLACAVSSPARADDGALEIRALATGVVMTERELASALALTPLVILGEIHDNPQHMALQARIVGAIAPGGLAFEHIPERDEPVVNGLLSHGTPAAEIGDKIAWGDLGWGPWESRAPAIAALVAATPEAYVAAGGVARSELMAAMRSGAAVVWGPDAPEWGLDIALTPAERAELTKEMITSHCNMIPAEVAETMIEAQRLRDARFAAALLRAQQKGPNGRAVLVTGNGHARTDRGVPFYLRVMAPDLALSSVGFVEEGTLLDGLPYDYVVVTSTVHRPDPCEGMPPPSDD